MKKKVEIIPWFVYATHLVVVQLVKYKQEDDSISYNAMLNIFLDDGESETLNDDRVVCISTDIFETDMEECLKDAVMSAATLYSNLSQFAQVVDGETGTVIQEIDLETIDFDIDGEVIPENDVEIPLNRVLH